MSENQPTEHLQTTSTSTPTPIATPLFDPASAVTTPSLVAKRLAQNFRITLCLILILNFVSFGMTLTIASADFVLLFLGYYGQDLMRPGALHLYFFLGLLSPFADLVPLIFEIAPFINNEVYWLVAVFILLYVIEVILKAISVFFARKLRNHLLTIPGQSV